MTKLLCINFEIILKMETTESSDLICSKLQAANRKMPTFTMTHSAKQVSYYKTKVQLSILEETMEKHRF